MIRSDWHHVRSPINLRLEKHKTVQNIVLLKVQYIFWETANFQNHSLNLQALVSEVNKLELKKKSIPDFIAYHTFSEFDGNYLNNLVSSLQLIHCKYCLTYTTFIKYLPQIPSTLLHTIWNLKNSYLHLFQVKSTILEMTSMMSTAGLT